MNITNAGVRGYNPTGVVIHNDAGSNGANTNFYNGWLPNHDPEEGFAHITFGLSPLSTKISLSLNSVLTLSAM